MAHTREPNTIEERTLAFLRDVHAQLKEGDDMPRVNFTAAVYRLPTTVVQAARRVGILTKHGWTWKWNVSTPTLRMVQLVRETQLDIQRTYHVRWMRKLRRKAA